MSTKNTPESSGILLATGEQVGHIQDLGAKRLRALQRDHAQLLVTNGGIYVQAYNKMLDGVLWQLANTITVIVKRVDYTLTPQQILDATGRRQYVDKAVLATIPKSGNGIVANVPFTFFKPGRHLSPVELAVELKDRKLVRDLYVQVAAAAQDPEFADTYPNVMNWELQGGGYGYMTFLRDDDGRYVSVGRDDFGWGDIWSFGGVDDAS